MRALRHARRSDSSSSSRNSNSALLDLEAQLEHLPFDRFQCLALLWLGAQGFRHIESLGRRYRRGRRSRGGADFIAQMPGSRVRVAIQVRHWRSPIQRRVVDELWGFMLRQNLPAGLILTNSTLSRKSITVSEEYPGRPIQLASRSDLADSMIVHGLGVEDSPDGPRLDESFFRSLNSLRVARSLQRNNFDGLGKQRRVPRLSTAPNGESASSLTQAALVAVGLGILFLILIWLAAGGGRP